MTDTRQPGLITPANAPRLADLNDDTSPYPAQITITCDGCPAVCTEDYLVPADSTKTERFEIARDHLRTRLGWICDEDGDYCPGCSTKSVLAEVQAERMRQIAKFGIQHREDGAGGPVMQHRAEEAQACADWLAENGGLDWRSLLLAQVYAAVAEDGCVGVRAGLVKTAALCTAWIEDIDSRTAKGQP